jgi:RNA polymerase sigma factor (sigma-70 family)
MEEKTDRELVEMAQKGNKEAFGFLVQRYQDAVQRFAQRMVSNSDLSQELTQEAWLQAYLSLEHLRDPDRFRSWTFGIVLNVCRSYLRDQRTAFFSLEAMQGGLALEAIPLTSLEASPGEMAEERELHRQVLGAVNTLAPGDRDVTLLFYYEQLSLREISGLLDVPVGVVKVRLHRARQRLKARLMSDYSEVIPSLPLPRLQPVNSTLKTNNRRKNMVKVTIADVIKKVITVDDNYTYTNYVVMLQDEAGKRALPIWVGPFEGQSIASGMGEFRTPRPLTFEFIASLLKAIDAKIDEIRIEQLKGDTFYSVVKISCGKTTREIDARPSDALALALRTGSPILASEELLERSGFPIPQPVKDSAVRPGVEKILQEMGKQWKPQDIIAEVFGK